MQIIASMQSMCYTFLFIAFVAIEFEFAVIKTFDFCDYRQDPIAFVVRATIWIVMLALILYLVKILLKSVFQKTIYLDLSSPGWKKHTDLLTAATSYATMIVSDAIFETGFNPHIIILWDGNTAVAIDNLTTEKTVKVLYDLFTSMGCKVNVVITSGKAIWEKHRDGILNEDLYHYGKDMKIIWTDEEWQDVTLQKNTVYFDLSGSGWKGNVGLLTVVISYAFMVVSDSIGETGFNPHIIILWDGDKAGDDNNLTIGNTVKVLYDLFTSMGYEVTVVARFGRAAWKEHRKGKLNEDLTHYGKNLEIIWTDEQWQDVLDKDGNPVLNKDGTPSRKPVYTGHKSVHGEAKRQRQKAITLKGKKVHGVFAFGGFLSKQDFEICINTRCDVAVWHTNLEYITNLRNIAVEAGYDVGLLYIAVEAGRDVDLLNPRGVVMKEGYILSEGNVLRFYATPRIK